MNNSLPEIREYLDKLQKGQVVASHLFDEPLEIIFIESKGDRSIEINARGIETNKFYNPILDLERLKTLELLDKNHRFNGDAHKFRIGIEALRLGFAHEYDPYFSLTIARIDPLPHQLEAVYNYFLQQPRIRFLLADDPGAGKTIMAGLLLKELKQRGLVKRTLILTPANLTFQWQRELKDKFRESFEVIRGDVLRSNYGMNPWQERNQVVTSLSWVSRIDDAKESLLRSHWDLIIVDEAHKMSAYGNEKKTLAYQLGERLSELTDHYLLMTATPHKGDPKNFCLFLELLDRDVYGDVASLEEAMRRNSAPFYLRRTKEALVTFPEPETGKLKKLFTRREVRTISFQIDSDEYDFYEALTNYVEDQSIKAALDDSSRGRALGFTMAMLQRRFASSVYAVRRSLERMCDKREKILQDPEGYRRSQIDRKLPDDYDELTETEQAKIYSELENLVSSIDPEDLRDEIVELKKLIRLAKQLEEREIETKLKKLRQVIRDEGVFSNPTMKLLLFTEHKDTLDYLVGKLQEWGLSVAQIHGGMKIGDRDTPGTRIYAEREFRETAQVLVATEAAGEGINLQFCWFAINYDIPWNPVRLEQRMGRIHRYGQEKDCLILNFVASNTREGRVLSKLFDRIAAIQDDLDPERTGKVFNVLGDIFPANGLEKMIREMYARSTTDKAIMARIVEEVDRDRLQAITDSALEGLVKRELNLTSILGKSVEAKERKLVPEVIRDFFLEASPWLGIVPKPTAKSGIYRIGKVPKALQAVGARLESRWGKLGREYKHITFNKDRLQDEPTLEWVTPGHPLFECVRDRMLSDVQTDLQQGAIFYDLHHDKPTRLDVFTATIQDGRAQVLHERLFVVETSLDGTMQMRQPTIFLDLVLGSAEAEVPDDSQIPDRAAVETFSIDRALQPFLNEVEAARSRDTQKILAHVEISLNTAIDRVQCQLGELILRKEEGSDESGIEGRIQMFEDKLYDLNERLERRRRELKQEQNCTISGIQHRGCAWVLPHPERSSPDMAAMVSNAEIERVAIEAAIAYEEARGWTVQSVESENRGFDLISRKPHPEDPQTAIAVRFIEVKGRSGVGEVALTRNEYRTAERLKADYWLYVAFDCATSPEVRPIQDPARLGWEPVMKVEHYRVPSSEIVKASEG
ncbi:helicase [Leptolyngbya valderiana BDU 20041]|nr:helicase [Leptolyngbya valderiana BDU 20041]